MRPAIHVILISIAATLCSADEASPTAPLKSEIPPVFTANTESFDFVRRTEMIPMRDGIKLYTVILIPRGAGRAPILLTRTPYDADERITQQQSKHLSAVLGNKDVADELVLDGGYIRVIQDIRGKHHSEGDYVMTRPLRGPLKPTDVDHSTDTYDTIDWLVKNISESNGKVGILGISYDGFTALMALFHPHPALRAAMPINPMVDGGEMIGRIMALFGNYRWSIGMIRRRHAKTKRNGGPTISTITNLGSLLAQPAKWPINAAWIKSGFIRNSWHIWRMMPSGKSKRWISCWRKNRSPSR